MAPANKRNSALRPLLRRQARPIVRPGPERPKGTSEIPWWARRTLSAAIAGNSVAPIPPATIASRVLRLLARKSPTSDAPATSQAASA